MKFSCNLKTLLNEISFAQDIISSKNSISIFSNILIKANDNNSLTIKATDMKVSFDTVVPAQVESEGVTTVHCNKFLNILKTMPDGDVNFVEENQKLILTPTNKKIKFQLNCLSPDKFPESPKVNENEFFEIPQEIFLDMISNTIFSISNDEARYYMNGVLLQKKDGVTVMVGTDSKRLSLFKNTEIEHEDFDGVIIPPKILHVIKRVASGEGNLSIAITEKKIFLKIHNNLFSSSLIDGKFPNYERILPKDFDKEIELEKNSFLDALKRVSLLSEQDSNRISITLRNGSIYLHSEENEYGEAEEEIECGYSGEEITINLNCNFLQDPLRVISSDKILIQLSSLDAPITLKERDNDSYFHIFMSSKSDNQDMP